MELPAGLTARPLASDDARAVFELMAASELETIGEVYIEQADIVGDWQRPSFDIASQSVGIFDAERLIAYAEVYKGRWADATVHPTYRGRGLGTELARWTQATAQRDGGDLVGMPVPEGSPGEALLRALGYQQQWTSWVLELPGGAAIEPQPIPAGYAVRESAGDADYRAAHAVIDEAFLEWSIREPETYEDFAANVVLRPGFEPWNLRLMVGPDGDVVGAVFVILADDEGYVDKLAVHRDHRNRGLGRALLVDAFAAARQHGATRSELSTDSRTGALTLYEKVGMVVTSRWFHLAIPV